MATKTDLESEQMRLTTVTHSIFQHYINGQIDLDDTIEELRPIRMRMRAIFHQLEDTQWQQSPATHGPLRLRLNTLLVTRRLQDRILLPS